MPAGCRRYEMEKTKMPAGCRRYEMEKTKMPAGCRRYEMYDTKGSEAKRVASPASTKEKRQRGCRTP